MSSTLHTGLVADKVAKLYELADDQRANWAPEPQDAWNGTTPGTARERADAMEHVYMPTISPMAGKLLYAVIRAAQPTAVVEFGMSFGISTSPLCTWPPGSATTVMVGCTPPSSAPPRS